MAAILDTILDSGVRTMRWQFMPPVPYTTEIDEHFGI